MHLIRCEGNIRNSNMSKQEGAGKGGGNEGKRGGRNEKMRGGNDGLENYEAM